MQRYLPIAVVLLIPVTAGCQTDSEGSNQQREAATELVSTPKWVLRKMTVGGKEWDLSLDSQLRKLVPDSQATISFTPTRVSGNTGCNSFSGTYQGKPDGTFQWQGVSVTEMPCPGKLAGQEEELLRLLSLANRWQVKNQVLTLSDGTAANELEFVPHTPVSLPLKETMWSLTHFTQSDDLTDSAEPALSDHPIDLQIKAGQASGSGGCNQFQCKVKILAGEELAFQEVVATEKACQAQVMQQEDRFLRALPQMTRYTIRENILTLSNDQGTLGLQFEGPK